MSEAVELVNRQAQFRMYHVEYPSPDAAAYYVIDGSNCVETQVSVVMTI